MARLAVGYAEATALHQWLRAVGPTHGWDAGIAVARGAAIFRRMRDEIGERFGELTGEVSKII